MDAPCPPAPPHPPTVPCAAAINEAARQAVLSAVTAPALLRAVEGRAGDQLVSAAAYLCGVLCDDEVAWRALLAEVCRPLRSGGEAELRRCRTLAESGAFRQNLTMNKLKHYTLLKL